VIIKTDLTGCSYTYQ